MFLKKILAQPIQMRFSSAFYLSLIMILAVFIAFAGCGDETTGPGINDDDNDINDVPDVPSVVEMVGESFSPANLQIEVGTTVTWENESDLTHTVTSGSDREHDDKFNSGDVAPGESYSYTFNEIGTFPYFCIPHPGMEGTVTVVESDNNDDSNDDDNDDDGY